VRAHNDKPELQLVSTPPCTAFALAPVNVTDFLLPAQETVKAGTRPSDIPGTACSFVSWELVEHIASHANKIETAMYICICIYTPHVRQAVVLILQQVTPNVGSELSVDRRPAVAYFHLARARQHQGAIFLQGAAVEYALVTWSRWGFPEERSLYY
jgi:hypothetical protein